MGHVIFNYVFHLVINMKSLINNGIVKWIILLMLLPSALSVDPSFRTDYDVLPGVTEFDGIPRNNFENTWLLILTAALGAIVQDGYTLLQTAREQDGGRDPGDPEDERRKHNLRKQRLAACILKYIKVESALYQTIIRLMPNDGVQMFRYIREVGKLPYTDEQKQEFVENWDKATMTNVGSNTAI